MCSVGEAPGMSLGTPAIDDNSLLSLAVDAADLFWPISMT